MDKKSNINGMTLKRVAVVTMLIDHIAASVLERWLVANGMYYYFTELAQPWTNSGMVLSGIYAIMRVIGRMAFPIYCFLITEGFIHTRHLGKYLRNMAVFALISEVPFDLAFQKSWLDMSYQNVYFTLLLGLLALTCISFFEKLEKPGKVLRVICAAAGTIACMAAAQLLSTDYGAFGVLAIVLIYLFRRKRAVGFTMGIAGVTMASWLELAALVDLPLIILYNGERGRGHKYFYYAFYPVHLLVLGLISLAMGI